jgi:sugar phosphate isomerase/epimerase
MAGCAAPACGARTCRGAKPRYHVAMAGYTYNKFKLDQTLADLEKYDVHYLCVKNFHLPFNATAAQIAEFKRKCADHGVTPYGTGPISIDNADDMKRRFDYTAAIGASILVGVPGEKGADGKMQSSRKMCEIASTLSHEYGIRFAIHNHGANPKTGNPRLYPTVPATYELIKDLDPNMGFCMDVAYTFADGFDPAEIVRKYGARIFDGHLRNISDPGNGSSGITAHRGVIDYLPFFRALAEIGYDGCFGLELANSFPNNPQWIPESLGYFRGLIAAV